MEEVDNKVILLKIELREHRKRESKSEKANLSINYESIFKW